jgi:peptidoglycan/LPS O-acetylase OafA/YrhL
MKKTVVLSVLIFICLLLGKNTYGLFDERLFIYLPVFVFGVLVAQENLLEALLSKRILLGTFVFAGIGAMFFFLFQGSRVNWVIQPIWMLSSLPTLLWCGKRCASCVPYRFYERIAYASFAMYLMHRVVYYIMLEFYMPYNDVVVVCYLITIGLPLLYLLSFYLQKIYDFLLESFMLGSHQ